MDEKQLQANKEKYLGWIRQLAMSQGFYGRLMRELEENEEALNELASQNFKEPLDMVLWFEE